MSQDNPDMKEKREGIKSCKQFNINNMKSLTFVYLVSFH